MTKIILKKKITKKAINKPKEVVVLAGWFSRLYEIAQRFQREPNELNKALLFGYISSAEYIVNKLTNEKQKS